MRASELPVRVVSTAEAAGELVAGIVLDEYVHTEGAFHLGCPAGRTPTTTYAALGRLAEARAIDLGRLVVVMMDEYLVDGVIAPRAAHFSCRRFLDEHLLPHVGDRTVICPDPDDPSAHDRIPIDLFLLASGTTDGHVAFNPPGTPIDSSTRVIELAQSTRRDNLATFPMFASIDEVPRFGVSSGLRTITSAHRAVLLLLGEGKATAYRRLLQCDGFDAAWPVSVICACANPLVVVDEAAAG